MADSHAAPSQAPAHGAATHGLGPAPAALGGGHATVRTYVNVAIVLAIITAAEVATLYIPGIPNALLVVSLLLMSAAKFALVVGFFMHLRYDHAIFRAMFLGPLAIAVCIILAVMALFSAFILLQRP
jgi:cytochrome c oxidase subunit 4